MKNNSGIWIFLSVVVIAWALYSSRQEKISAPPVTSEVSGSANYGQAQDVPVTIIAMYKFIGATIVFKTKGEGSASGGIYGSGYNFNWVDKGETIELTNFNSPRVDNGVATCKKFKDYIEMSWHWNGNYQYEKYWKVKIQ
ncbi:MAG: hypothetical protein WCP93_01960 [Candidatus Berkelbacteria bacterium]